MKIVCVVLTLVVLLTGCGGGGSTTPSTAFFVGPQVSVKADDSHQWIYLPGVTPDTTARFSSPVSVGTQVTVTAIAIVSWPNRSFRADAPHVGPIPIGRDVVMNITLPQGLRLDGVPVVQKWRSGALVERFVTDLSREIRLGDTAGFAPTPWDEVEVEFQATIVSVPLGNLLISISSSNLPAQGLDADLSQIAR